ncbi:hypothetical protein [Dysosmobacter sp.]|uniref:hypothetical protein n=1 Tax=Dysosmobacter sp. TaxID=2591382 RepID=UPI002A98FAB7|nr:hypothetical protein [Dysosmobacter sp.]MDY5611926.1 hypothetical protein [Dysosmobacter sp.]
MANYPHGRDRQGGHGSGPPPREPEVRRWPHPVGGAERSLPASARETDAALYYIHCALSYQNQLLADIKVLLEQLSVDLAQSPEEK